MTDSYGRPRVVIRAGNYQTVRAGLPFLAQLSVLVVDREGLAMAGHTVNFRVVSGAAAFARSSRSSSSVTSASGIGLSGLLAAGDHAGTVMVVASAGVAVKPATFTLRVTKPLPDHRRRSPSPYPAVRRPGLP